MSYVDFDYVMRMLQDIHDKGNEVEVMELFIHHKNLGVEVLELKVWINRKSGKPVQGDTGEPHL